jgi:hypothetical protein
MNNLIMTRDFIMILLLNWPSKVIMFFLLMIVYSVALYPDVEKINNMEPITIEQASDCVYSKRVNETTVVFECKDFNNQSDQ